MRAGIVLEERFEILDQIGAGGMGSIWRALDRATGAKVAVKVMQGAASGRERERFVREAALLEGLDHPGIVRYVHHGTAADGEPYLAMELLEGEDLSVRLEGRGITLAEAQALARVAASALGHAHARGVVHRDIKPSNVFLVGGDAQKPKLLDFGIARAVGLSRGLTKTGAILGTVGYMAPEQASGAPADARADVFSLGCVLFECVTGSPAFAASTPLGVLARLILAEAPRARALQPSVPVELDELLAAMLARDPAARPKNGDEVAVRLGTRVTGVPPGAPSSLPLSRAVDTRSFRMTTAERRVHTVVVAKIESAEAADDATLLPDQALADFGPLEEAKARYGGRLALLGPNVVALSLEGRTSAVDQAVQAAQAALALLDARADVRVSVSTGRFEDTSTGPVGPLVDRAIELLMARDTGEGAYVDDVTRDLLGQAFVVRTEGGVHRLVGRHAGPSIERLVLGKATPCVGRERELAELEATVAECIDEGIARAMLVTSPPGGGKSRLAEELLWRVRDAHPELSIVTVRAEAMRATSALGLVRELMRARFPDVGAAAAGACDDAAETKTMLAVEAGGVAAELLAELTGAVGTLGKPSADGDPFAIREALGRAFDAWVRREAEREPQFVIIEDLQWADPTSVELLVSAFRAAAELPVAVLVLARPEVTQLFPSFAKDLGASEIRLAALTRRAAAKLVRAAVGEGVSDADVARVFDLSEGNAFYLEELARWMASGATGALPESVVAMAQVRLSSLDDDARRTLRAASVIGEVFDVAAVSALLGDGADPTPTLVRLAKAEVLVRREADGGRFAFRHALLQSAAYGMLTDADRRGAHARAAEHVASSAKLEASLVAEHYQLAGDSVAAARWFYAAARAAFDSGDLSAAITLIGRGLACKVEPAEAAELRVLEAAVRGVRGDWAGAGKVARVAMSEVPRGSTVWFSAAAAAVFSDINEGRVEGVIEMLRVLVDVDAPAEPSREYGRAISMLVAALVLTGQASMAAPLLERLERVSRPDEDVTFTIFRETARCFLAFSNGDVQEALVAARSVTPLLRYTVDPMARVLPRVAASRPLVEIGRLDEGLGLLAEAIDVADRTGMVYVRDFARSLASGARVVNGRVDAGVRADLESLTSSGSLVVRLTSLLSLGNLALVEGDVATAERYAERSVDTTGLAFVDALRAVLSASVLFMRGDAEGALAVLGPAFRVEMPSTGLAIGTRAALLRARALTSLGRVAEARESIAERCAHLDRVAATLAPDDRRSFLEDVPTNVRLLDVRRDLG